MTKLYTVLSNLHTNRQHTHSLGIHLYTDCELHEQSRIPVHPHGKSRGLLIIVAYNRFEYSEQSFAPVPRERLDNRRAPELSWKWNCILDLIVIMIKSRASVPRADSIV